MLILRNLGFKPSKANKEAIAKALDNRPNQAPLIEALKETVAYQRKLQAQAQNANAGQQPRVQLRLRPAAAGHGSDAAAGRAAGCRRHHEHRRLPRPDRLAAVVLDDKLLSILVCPEDRGPLLLVDDEFLYNPRLRRAYRIEDGIPVLLVDEAVAVTDDAEHQRLLDRASGESG